MARIPSRDSRTARRFRTVGAVGLFALLTLGACDEPRAPHKYVVLSGIVAACHPQTGELTVRLSESSSRRTKDDRLECVVTSDSEVYINDMFSSIERIQIGDQVELIGYRDVSRPIESFVVSFAYCDHSAPTPGVPPLLQPPDPPQSQPASAPAAPESQPAPETQESP